MPPAGGPSSPARHRPHQVRNGPCPRTVLTVRGHVQSAERCYGMAPAAELVLALGDSDVLAVGLALPAAPPVGDSDALALALGDSDALAVGLALPAAPPVGDSDALALALALGDSDVLALALGEPDVLAVGLALPAAPPDALALG